MPRFQPLHILVLLFTLLTPVLFWLSQSQSASTVYLKEASFTNNAKEDWLDLYNPTLNSISMKGYFLSDNLDDPTKWQFTSDWVIGSHQTLRVYGKASDSAPYGSARLNFNLGNGETLVLTARDGKSQIDRMTLLAPPNYEGSFTMGRPGNDLSITEVFYQETTGAGH